METHDYEEERYLREQEVLEADQAAKDEWVESGLEDYMKDPEVFKEFLKESASEGFNEGIHKALMEQVPDRFLILFTTFFKYYCRQSLNESWEMKIRG